jgi:hypothetical protein
VWPLPAQAVLSPARALVVEPHAVDDDALKALCADVNRRLVVHAGLRKRFQSEFGSVAILTPYKAQQRVLQNIFRFVLVVRLAEVGIICGCTMGLQMSRNLQGHL